MEHWKLPTIQHVALDSVEGGMSLEQAHCFTTALLDLLIESYDLLFERRGRIGSMRIQDIDLSLASIEFTTFKRNWLVGHLRSLQTLQT